jgi:hypothetical protein
MLSAIGVVNVAMSEPAAAAVCGGNGYNCTNPDPNCDTSISHSQTVYAGARAFRFNEGNCRTVWARVASGSFNSGTLMTRTNSAPNYGFVYDTLNFPLYGGNQWTAQLNDAGWYGYSCGWTGSSWACSGIW